MELHPIHLWTIYGYDGPIDGVAELNGEKMYFNTRDIGGWTSYEPTANEIVAIEKEISGDGPEVDDIYWDDDSDSNRVYYTCEDRIYNFYRLPNEIYEHMEENHDEFLRMVTDLDATKETRREFYKKHKNDSRVDTNKLEFVGTFTSFQRSSHTICRF